MPVGGGSNLGNAQGRITIDTADLRNVEVRTQQVAAEVERNFGRIGASSQRAQTGFQNVAAALSPMLGALGFSLGTAGVVQLGRMAAEADRLATAYERQRVAAVQLAGSQAELNDLLAAYDRATGGAIDTATALGDVVRLQAVGFADNAAELEQFARAARGIAVAMGSSQDYIISQLQLAIANQSTMRLDQLGLGISEVEQRIAELRAANKGLSNEMAYQQAILELAEKKFGALADSHAAAATGMERLGKSAKNAQLAMGEAIAGPMNLVGNLAANMVEQQTQKLRAWMREVDVYIRLLRSLGMAGPWLTTDERAMVDAGAARDRGRHARVRPDPNAPAPPRWNAAQAELILARGDALAEIEDDAQQQRLDSARQYETQRTEIVRTYGQTMAREEEDFARQRARAEAAYQDQVADVRADAARREAQQAADFAREQQQAAADRADRLAAWEADYQDAVADRRADAQARLADLEEEYQRSRVDAAADHRDRLLDAASRLDAVAVRAEQDRYAREEERAAAAYQRQRQDQEEALAEQLADLREAYAARLADEAAAWDKSTQRQQEAFDRQRAQQEAEDQLRLEALAADFAERKRLEDEDRAVRLGRAAADYQANLDELDRQHALDLQRITDHAGEARAQLDAEFYKDLDAQGKRSDAWLAAKKTHDDAVMAEFDRLWEHVTDRVIFKGDTSLYTGKSETLGNPPGSTRSWTNPNLPASPGARTLTVEAGAVTIYAAPGMDEEAIGDIVEQRLIELLEGAAE